MRLGGDGSARLTPTGRKKACCGGVSEPREAGRAGVDGGGGEESGGRWRMMPWCCI